MIETKFKKEDVDRLLEETREATRQAKKLLDEKGVEYDLTKWVTIKRYCTLFDISNTETVSNWIKRGIIPPENIKEIEELNGLKLIKAVAYR